MTTATIHHHTADHRTTGPGPTGVGCWNCSAGMIEAAERFGAWRRDNRRYSWVARVGLSAPVERIQRDNPAIT